MSKNPTIFLTNYDIFTFSKSNPSEIPDNNNKFIPIFGVGDIKETKIYCMTARPLKISEEAVNYYQLKNQYLIEDLKTHKAGVIRRTVQNNEKTDEYYCQKCTIVDILHDHNYTMAYVTVVYKNKEGNDVTEDININRICIPKLINIKKRKS